MEYKFYKFNCKAKVIEQLNSNNKEIIIKTLVGMVNGINDWKWLQDKYLDYISHEDFWIAKNAITGLGDIARVFGKLDRKKVISSLKEINRIELRPIIKATLDDIKNYTQFCTE